MEWNFKGILVQTPNYKCDLKMKSFNKNLTRLLFNWWHFVLPLPADCEHAEQSDQ